MASYGIGRRRLMTAGKQLAAFLLASERDEASAMFGEGGGGFRGR
ncbi:hypothetical protein BRO54_2206 [Geobacillus proteiniphilus]|uniref:Uncharacterized protein n=1 Tax=Geobacillus proteiniphilus TaxID=860353 RepID=A0A1Q5SY47_9BACL|nr:hypothetical protein BRO54_2206 [Geobacillus proteiniphilus]